MLTLEVMEQLATQSHPHSELTLTRYPQTRYYKQIVSLKLCQSEAKFSSDKTKNA